MNNPLGDLTKLVDVFFNGRRATPNQKVKVPHAETILELARRGISQVKIEGKRYRVTCKEVEK